MAGSDVPLPHDTGPLHAILARLRRRLRLGEPQRWRIAASARTWKQARDYVRAMRSLDSQCRSGGFAASGPGPTAGSDPLLPSRLVDGALGRGGEAAGTRPEPST